MLQWWSKEYRGERGQDGTAIEWAMDFDRERSVPLAQEFVVRTEYLDTAAVTVGDVERAVTGQRDIGWVVEFARPNADLATLSPLGNEKPIRFQMLNPLVVKIDYIEIAVRCDYHTARGVELARAVACTADVPLR